jgi:hypothetical protein
MAGSKEDTETVRAFFQDMRARGALLHGSGPVALQAGPT